jgi:hypothetical protein
MKIFITGPAGSGKSMAGVRLIKAIAKWISYYIYGNFDHAEEFFKFDKEHVAVIDTKDLIYVMTRQLRRFSCKLIDDIGAAEGFTSRRSMSGANLDIVSVYGTNRTQNGVAVYCVQDKSYADKRMRELGNVEIDFTEYTTSGSFRVAILRKIKKLGDNQGVRLCRFMTYENGQWVTQETIGIDLPDYQSKKIYDDLRDKKEAENSKKINEKYSKMVEANEVKDNRPKCPHCGSTRLYYGTKGNRCNNCGRHF